MKLKTLAVTAMLAVAVVAIPASGQLTNGGLETWSFGSPVGWSFSPGLQVAKSWTLFSPGCLPPGTPGDFGECPAEGVEYATLHYGNNPPPSDLWLSQTATVVSGGEYKISGFIAGGGDINTDANRTTDYYIRVHNGSSSAGALLAEYAVRIDNGTGHVEFNWQEAERYFKTTSTQVYLEVGCATGGGWFSKAVHLDGFVLAAVSTGATQHEITSASNASVDFESAATNVVISGTNLHLGDAVKLQLANIHEGQPESPSWVPVEITGTIVNNATNGQLTVSFPTDDIDGNGTPAPLGLYNIIVSQTGHNDRVLSQGFEVECPEGAMQFTTLGGDLRTGLIGSSSLTLSMSGNNLDAAKVTNVQLVRTRSRDDYDGVNENSTKPGGDANPLVGTNIRQDGANVLVDFDLSAATLMDGPEAGRYAVEVEADAPCGAHWLFTVASGYENDVFLYLPMNTEPGQVFHNASFEDGYAGDTGPGFCQEGYAATHYSRPTHWDFGPLSEDMAYGVSGLSKVKRDGYLGMGDGNPGSCTLMTGREGDHFLYVLYDQRTEPKDSYVFQTVQIPAEMFDPDGTLADPLSIRASVGFHAGALDISEAWTVLDLVAGRDGGTILATSPAVGPNDPFGLDVNENYVATIPDDLAIEDGGVPTDLLTVRLRIIKPNTTTAEFLILDVDDVSTEVPFQCNMPFADADDDDDVDADDFALFQICHSGDDEAYPELPEYCQCFDQENSSDTVDDVDNFDLTEFEKCATGPGVAWSAALTPGCIDNP